MRNKLPLAVIAVVGLGLLTTSSIPAQRAANNNSQSEDATAKPCVLVFGAVRSPSRFELQRLVRLAEGIEMAGGPNDKASETIHVIHGPAFKCGQLQIQVGSGCIDCRQTIPPLPPMNFYKLSELHGDDEKVNPYLQPGDIVVIQEQPVVYVVGNVMRPQAVVVGPGLTLTQAIAMAGGVLPDTDTKRVRIIKSKKPGDSTMEEIIVDLKAIKKHRAEDPVLQPDYVVDVPTKRRGDRFSMGPVFFDTRQLPLRVIM